MAIKQYYIPLIFDNRINYLYFLRLYSIATYNTQEKIYNLIHYDSYKNLSSALQVSQPTISRYLSNEVNQQLFEIDKEKKTIYLKNQFRKSSSKEKKTLFVPLNEKEINYLIEQNDDLLVKYYLYLKWNCGKWNYRENNFTANQFLSAFGLCLQSGANKTKISGYNKKLITAGFIYISKWVDEKGRIRNTYTLQQQKNTTPQIDCGNASNLCHFIF